MKPNTWAMLCHLSGLVGYAANGFGSVLAPLLIWIIKKDEMPEVDQHGKEALNFNISVAIYSLILAGLTFVSLGVLFFITVPLMVLLAIFHVVCIIMAAMKANKNELFRYPLTMRLIT